MVRSDIPWISPLRRHGRHGIPCRVHVPVPHVTRDPGQGGTQLPQQGNGKCLSLTYGCWSQETDKVARWWGPYQLQMSKQSHIITEKSELLYIIINIIPICGIAQSPRKRFSLVFGQGAQPRRTELGPSWWKKCSHFRGIFCHFLCHQGSHFWR